MNQTVRGRRLRLSPILSHTQLRIYLGVRKDVPDKKSFLALSIRYHLKILAIEVEKINAEQAAERKILMKNLPISLLYVS
jgi:hypothetical protein